jgi:hypothetical protein
MTTYTETQKMSSKAEPEPERALTAGEDDPHIIFERCGCRCQVCGVVGHPHGLEDVVLITYPLHPDYPADVGIVVCNDCFIRHTDEQLDEYVAEMQEQQRALEKDPGDYQRSRERAFERDDHTCQLCGQEGYPKTERGLVAYPVRAGDYHLDNLVTVCNDCITDTLDSDEDDQKAADRLRLQATRAKEWVNSDADRPEQAENVEDHR